MVKTRAQRSQSTTNTPSPGPLSARTKKRRSAVVSIESRSTDQDAAVTKPNRRDCSPSVELKGKTQSRTEERILKTTSGGKMKTGKGIAQETKISVDVEDGKASQNEEEIVCIAETDLDESDQDEETNSSVSSDGEVENESTVPDDDAKSSRQPVVSVETHSDDEGPEDVSFNQSRRNALDHLSQVLEQTKQKKNQLKEKRKARDELFTQQKKKKYESSRLSEDFIKEVAQEEEIAREQDVLTMKESGGTHVHFDEEEDDGHSKVEEEKGFTEKLGIEVVTLPKLIQKPNAKSDVAVQFLKSQLYGSRIQRQSVNELHASAQKHKGMPAFKFVTGKAFSKKKKLKPKKDGGTWSSLT